jgi:hypothetical protein
VAVAVRPLVLVVVRSVLVRDRAALELGDKRGQCAGQGVHLVGVQLSAVVQGRRVLGEDALEAEQQGVVAAPLDRRGLVAGLDLGDRVVEGHAPRGPRRQVLEVLAFEQEGFTRELSRAF